MNLSLYPWIFKDDRRISTADRDLLCNYLHKHNIVFDGHFKKALKDNSGSVWKYPAFAVKNYPSDPLLIKKLRLLSPTYTLQKSHNEVERQFQNQLVEFHALYACVALMGYHFDGWDKQSGKAGADPKKDCDLAFTKNKEKVFADAKDVSSEILSLDEIPGCPGLKFINPKIELTAWLKGQIRNVKKKGADFLICHTPGWGLTSFDEPIIKQWLNSILPDTLIMTDEGPVWQIDSQITQIIIIKPEGCLKIRVEKI